MAIIVWIVKAQWCFTVDRLTYEKLWSIERVSNLLIGSINLALILISLLFQSNILIVFVLFNAVMLKRNLLHSLLARCGFQKKEDILQHLSRQAHARENFEKTILAGSNRKEVRNSSLELGGYHV